MFIYAAKVPFYEKCQHYSNCMKTYMDLRV